MGKFFEGERQALEKWDSYTYAKYKVLSIALEDVPWHIIKSSVRESVIELIKIILSISFESIERVQNKILESNNQRLKYYIKNKIIKFKKENLKGQEFKKREKEIEKEIEILEINSKNKSGLLDLSPNPKFYKTGIEELAFMNKSGKIGEPFDFHKDKYIFDTKTKLYIPK